MMVSPGVLGLEPVPWGAHWLMMHVAVKATKAAAAEAAPAATAPRIAERATPHAYEATREAGCLIGSR
jgi:hypothetical protein